MFAGKYVGAQDAAPKDPYAGDIWSRSTLTGDWWGIRNQLAEKGITFDINITQVGQGVVDGGLNGAWQYGARRHRNECRQRKARPVAGRIFQF